ncbi:hypothetical protein IHE26_06760 [Plesiomonas shigelloides]|uniref:hypothetical protein n=1 Tax=Plesiomonas shigelloides TaxID=703 RepID=UPI0017840DEF|nr:hypothetical protein [Plesiomonas shigelloides]QOH80960.1 hypothetical protein IHE26_06760 [Plesiomonas shigelloides]
MKIISYWKNIEEIHEDDGLVLIIGWYDHKHEYNGGHKSLGIHWSTYPQSRGVLSPCVIPKETTDAMLSGLLHKAVTENNKELIKNIIKAMEFLNT